MAPSGVADGMRRVRVVWFPSGVATVNLLRSNEIEQRDIVKTIGSRPWGPIIMFAIVACPVYFVVDAISTSGMKWLADLTWWGWALASPVLAVVVGLWFLIISGSRSTVLACFRSTNWVIKVALTGVYVQFRSHLNYHFPGDDATVVFVPFSEIDAVQRTRHGSIRFDSSGNKQEETTSYLDIHLKGVDIEPLKRAVARESAMKPQKKGFSSMRFNHVPVRVVDGQAIRIEWRGNRMIEALKRYVDVRPARRTGIGHEAKPPGVDEQITELVEKGDTIGAARMVRCEYGMSLTEARTFVDELQDPKTQPIEEEVASPV